MGTSWRRAGPNGKSGRTWWPWRTTPWAWMGTTVETKQSWSWWTSNGTQHGRAQHGSRSGDE